jgi:hypothetical protein
MKNATVLMLGEEKMQPERRTDNAAGQSAERGRRRGRSTRQTAKSSGTHGRNEGAVLPVLARCAFSFRG